MLPFHVGPGEMMFFGMIALLLFGSKLPEVARSLGKGLTEFKKGLSGVESEVRTAIHSNHVPTTYSRPAQQEERVPVTAPRFELPTSEPQEVPPSNTTNS